MKLEQEWSVGILLQNVREREICNAFTESGRLYSRVKWSRAWSREEMRIRISLPVHFFSSLSSCVPREVSNSRPTILFSPYRY